MKTYYNKLVILIGITIWFAINSFCQIPHPSPPPPPSSKMKTVEKFEVNGKIGFRDALNKKIVLPAQFDEIIGYTNRILIAVRQGEKYGYISKSGEIVVPIIYDDLKPFSSGRCVVKKGKKWGIVSTSNRILLPFKYNEIGEFLERITVKKGQKWGVLSSEYQWIVKPKYKGAKLFRKSICIKKGKKWGFVNNQNEILTDFRYDEVERYYSYKKLFKTRIDKKWGYINNLGKEVFPIDYEEINIIATSIFKVKRNGKWGIINAEKPDNTRIKYDSIADVKYLNHKIAYLNCKAGLMDKKGDLVTKLSYDEIIVTDNSKNPSRFYADHKFNVRTGKNWGALDKEGKILRPVSENYLPKHLGYYIKFNKGKFGVLKGGKVSIPPIYDDINRISDTIFLVVKKTNGSQIGRIVDGNHKEFLGIEYTNANYNYGARLITLNKNEKYGAINKKGDVVFKLEYDYFGAFNKNGLTKAKKDRKWGVINENGQTIIPFIHEHIDDINIFSPLIEVTKDNLVGAYNKLGELIIPTIYDRIITSIRMDTKNFLVVKDKKYGCININGEKILPLIYDDLRENFEFEMGKDNAYIRLAKENLWGLFDVKGKVVLNTKYERIDEIKDDLVKLKSNGHWGAYNLRTNKQIPTIYDDLHIINKDRFFVKSNQKWGCIDKENLKIVPLVFDSIGGYSIPSHLFVLQNQEWYLTTENSLLNTDFNSIKMIPNKVSGPFDDFLISTFNKRDASSKIAVKRNGKWGFIDSFGQELIDFVYDDVIKNYNHRFIKVKYQDKWGFLDKNGRFIE